MFKCDSCKCSSGPGDKPTRIATQRPKIYTEFRKIYDPDTRRTKREEYQTEGFEITSEMKFCKACVGE